MRIQSHLDMSEINSETVAREPVSHVELLTTDECGKLFSALREKLRWTPRKSGHASEMFFGRITGKEGLDKVKKVSKVVIDGKVYRINDMHGKTRYIDFAELRKVDKLAKTVINGAVKLFTARIGSDEFSNLRLQCNINAYSIHQQLDWHRDEPVDKGEATSNTFWPGSATLFLLNPNYELKRGSFLYRRMLPTTENKTNKVEPFNRKGDPGPNYPQCLESAPVGQGSLTGIFDSVYSHGIHRNDVLEHTSLGSVPTDEIMRISLNFRYLRKGAYLACNGKLEDW